MGYIYADYGLDVFFLSLTFSVFKSSFIAFCDIIFTHGCLS